MSYKPCLLMRNLGHFLINHIYDRERLWAGRGDPPSLTGVEFPVQISPLLENAQSWSKQKIRSEWTRVKVTRRYTQIKVVNEIHREWKPLCRNHELPIVNPNHVVRCAHRAWLRANSSIWLDAQTHSPITMTRNDSQPHFKILWTQPNAYVIKSKKRQSAT